MSASPGIAQVAALIGDRARATMLTTLMAGQSLTATELARVACVTKQTASAHLSKLVAANLIAMESSGRHRYFRLAHADVGAVIEGLMGVAPRVVGAGVEPGPPDVALRKARTCYDHLAGELGVFVLESLSQRKLVRAGDRELRVTQAGADFFAGLGIDLDALQTTRRALCLTCLDWSVRRHHLAGALGAAILDRCFSLRWATRKRGTRVVYFSALGERALRREFGARN
jgi:DNA-binding transcriptional ArsR family regulator